MLAFAGLDLGREVTPDETAVCKFRHLPRSRANARVRAKVEHSIGVVKRAVGLQKVRYWELPKNLHRR